MAIAGWPEAPVVSLGLGHLALKPREMYIVWKRCDLPDGLDQRTALRIYPTLVPDNRSSLTACLRRSRAGGDFAFYMHFAHLADRFGRRAPGIRGRVQKEPPMTINKTRG